jgi:hypothetical protein
MDLLASRIGGDNWRCPHRTAYAACDPTGAVQKNTAKGDASGGRPDLAGFCKAPRKPGPNRRCISALLWLRVNPLAESMSSTLLRWVAALMLR